MTTARAREHYHHGDLESALIETARKLIKQNGFEHLSLRQVAAEIGVSPSAAYHYFPDRDSLLAAVGFALFDELADYQDRELAKVKGDSAKSAKDRFRILGRTYFEWASREPHFFNLMFSGICIVDSKTMQNKRDESRAFANLSKCLDDLLSHGCIEKQTREYGEIISWSVVHGATSLIVSGHLSPELYENVLDGIEHSLGISTSRKGGPK